jgi:hypothetical protein
MLQCVPLNVEPMTRQHAAAASENDLLYEVTTRTAVACQ